MILGEANPRPHWVCGCGGVLGARSDFRHFLPATFQAPCLHDRATAWVNRQYGDSRSPLGSKGHEDDQVSIVSQ